MGGASSVDTATGEAGKGSKGAAARDERAAAPAARAQADVVVGVAQEGDQAALARLEAEAFASKFSHVGLNRQQAIAVSAVDFEYNFTVMAPRCGVVRRCDIDAAMAGDMVPAGGGEAPDDDDAGAAAAADGGDADGTDREVVGKVQLELPGDRDARVKPPDDAWVQAAGGLWKSLRVAKLSTLDSHRVEPDEAYIATICVASSARGHGIGGALMRWADAEARRNGLRRITLAVSTANRAVRLYERHGFVVTTRSGGMMSRFFTGEPGFAFMEKILDYQPATGGAGGEVGSREL